MNELLTIAGKALAAILVIYIAPAIKAKFKADTHSTSILSVMEIVKTFVRSVEQTEKGVHGIYKKQKVVKLLEESGITVTPEVDAFIEGFVYQLNEEKK